MPRRGIFNRECGQFKACKGHKRAMINIKGKFNFEHGPLKAYQGKK